MKPKFSIGDRVKVVIKGVEDGGVITKINLPNTLLPNIHKTKQYSYELDNQTFQPYREKELAKVKRMLLCIDPGLSNKPGGTGWALFDDEEDLLAASGILFPEGGTWEIRIDSIVFQFRSLVLSKANYRGYCGLSFFKKETDVYIELPNFFQSQKGMACATGKNGDDSDIVKLSSLVGELRRTAIHLGFRSINYVPVKWKGQLKKYPVALRIANRLGPGVTVSGTQTNPILVHKGKIIASSHAIDAVGIGLYVKGKFKANEGRI